MKFSNSIAVFAACATLALPVGASAQFGGLGHVLGGGSSTPNPSAASPADGDAFLANALMSTKNVMISAKLLSAALVKRSDKAALKGAYSDEAGHLFRAEAGHRTDLKPAIIPG